MLTDARPDGLRGPIRLGPLAGWRVRAGVAQLAGWLVVGLAAVAGELGLLALLHEQLGLALWLASALASELAMLARFAVTDRFVFGYRRPSLARALKYHGACAGAFAVSWGVLNGVSAVWEAPYRLAWLLGTGAGLGWSAASSFLWVWAGPSRLAWLPGQAQQRAADGHVDAAQR